MNLRLLHALLPLVLLGATALVLMLQAMIRRQRIAAAGLTLAGMLAALVAARLGQTAGSEPLTPLFVFDPFAAFTVALVILAACGVVLLSVGYLARTTGRAEEFYLLLCLATLGAASMAMSRHLASLFLGLELMSISLYALIAFVPGRARSTEAGIKYLVLASGSSAAMLFGMALIYFQLGTLEFGRFAAQLGSAGFEPVLVAGLAMLVIGFGFKLALVPFHFWSPDVYQGAPAPVTAFVASVSKAAAAAVLLRLFLQLGLVAHPWWALVFAGLAAASMFVGNLLALLQGNLKRLLAYSSIAHFGYLLVAALAGGPEAGAAVAFYLVAYLVTTLGAFGVIAALSSQGEELEELTHYRGLGFRRPWLAAVLTLMLLSLAGIPLTAGFVGKFLVLGAGVGAMLWGLVLLMVVTSVAGLAYYLRVIVSMYMRTRTLDGLEPVAVEKPIGWLIALALTALSAMLLWLGVFPATLLDWIRRATVGLL